MIFKAVAMGGEGIKDAHVDFDRTGMQPKISHEPLMIRGLKILEI